MEESNLLFYVQKDNGEYLYLKLLDLFWYDNICCEEAGTSIGLRFVRKAAEAIARVSIKERKIFFISNYYLVSDQNSDCSK